VPGISPRVARNDPPGAPESAPGCPERTGSPRNQPRAPSERAPGPARNTEPTEAAAHDRRDCGSDSDPRRSAQRTSRVSRRRKSRPAASLCRRLHPRWRGGTDERAAPP
jgi:hypothetical protein